MLSKTPLLLFALAAWWTLSLPLYCDLAAFFVLTIILIRSRTTDYCLLLFALTGSIAGFELLLRNNDRLITTRYREHEQSIDGSRYLPHLRQNVFSPYGDISAINPSLPRDIREPRFIRFQTDKLGFRNDVEYAPGDIVLIGDSFIAATGMDQDTALPAVLRHIHGLAAYSIAFPLEPANYGTQAEWFQRHVDANAKFAFFYFEGNDFGSPASAMDLRNIPVLPLSATRLLDTYDWQRHFLLTHLAPALRYPRLVWGMSRRLERRFFMRYDFNALVAHIGDKQMAFYLPYLSAALNSKPEAPALPASTVIKQLACVFFIPDKSRVYARFLPDPIRQQMQEPSPAYNALRHSYAAHGITVVDLTAVLRRAAEEHLRRSEYVYWRDDTHWNRQGITTAAQAVYECLISSRD